MSPTAHLAQSFRLLLCDALRVEEPLLPAVPAVNCSDCRRVAEGSAKEDVRCCDVVPQFPNFLVGEILATQPHPVLRTWIAKRRGDPFAMQVPPAVALQHTQARVDGAYGLPCPMLLEGEGRCSVYEQRPPLCVGYHCYYPSSIWKEAWSCLASSLDLLQEAASRFLVSVSSLDALEMASVWQSFPDEASIWVEESQASEAYHRFWQTWEGKEAEFYVWCFNYLQDNAVDVRREIRVMQREFLWERLAREGKLNRRRERLLHLEQKHAKNGKREAQPKAMKPETRLRRRYAKAYVPAAYNELTIYEQESHLLWYRKQLLEAKAGHWLTRILEALR